MIVGVDTGGTFTDFVVVDNGEIRIHKEPSTPDDPARAILNGLARLVGAQVVDVIHGSTVATNALLERKGAAVALVTTEGFEDVLEIGRQTRRSIYDIAVDRIEPLVPAARRLGIAERVDNHGRVLSSPAAPDLRRLVQWLREISPDSIAVCLLHSYANPQHERTISDLLRSEFPECFVTASHEVVPEFREYERFSTTAMNAYIGPVMRSYLGRLERSLSERVDRVAASGKLMIMQSNGGVMSAQAARNLAVHTVLSGPAGGAVGGFECGKRAGFDNVISFDMGGTSTDVSLAAGSLGLTSEGSVGELPVRIPILDIHTVGAGGGSIAFRDPGGSLRVGPRSAGAEPGPICYGRGGAEVTVTDANLVLGRLSPRHFLGGDQLLDVDAAREGVQRLAQQLHLTADAAAEGVIRVANATMERAMRVISLERGHDPRDFTLVCFGGAGGMHAADLARSLGIPRVVVPPAAGVLSALGMLLADFVRDYSRTLLVELGSGAAETVARTFDELERQARDDCAAEGLNPHELRLEQSADMRYTGQGYELAIPWTRDPREEFNVAHERRYGYSDRRRPLQIVNVRIRASVAARKHPVHAAEVEGEDSSAARTGETAMLFDGRRRTGALLERALLRPGNLVRGPALVTEYSTTTVVPPDYCATIDQMQNLVLSRCNG
jgi:N-methylhydantoinase A/oxoprolinase/acetone carboxylase beta subunit